AAGARVAGQPVAVRAGAGTPRFRAEPRRDPGRGGLGDRLGGGAPRRGPCDALPAQVLPVVRRAAGRRQGVAGRPADRAHAGRRAGAAASGIGTGARRRGVVVVCRAVFRRIGRVAAIVCVLALAAAPGAAAQVQPYGANDFGGFRNILPPGQNGLDDAAQAAAFKAAGAYPPHSGDQLGMYSGLTTAVPITESQIPQFYKDATFGVPSGDVAGTESPEPGVTIERDSKFGVPHIYGDTRAALMFGIGYASAEDRLFFMDVLRHAGRGELAQFAGGANVGMDESVWQNEPYNEQDLTNQVNSGAANLPDGQQIMSDATNYIDGINAYIATAKSPLNELT